MDIDTLDVLDTASTKWNFLNFRPGLVGGHCIGIDPYYLTWKSRAVGYEPKNNPTIKWEEVPELFEKINSSTNSIITLSSFKL